MNKNDDTIQKLFDDYAEDLNERSDLADRAKAALVAKNAEKSKRRELGFWKWLAPVCCALIIVVVSISIFAPSGLLGDGGSEQPPNQGTNTHVPTLTYYTAAEVKGRSVSLSDYDETLKISQIKQDGDYQVVYERYYAFYFEDGALAYVKAVLGVRSDEGLCEIAIVAEADGVVRQDLRSEFDFYLKRGGDRACMFTDLDDKGEFVTSAYFNARSAHFYVYALTGANDELAEKIISKIL